MNDVLTLITRTITLDEYGDSIITDKRREVFCAVMSIGQKEFYEAHAVGLQPEVKFKIADNLDYSGENYVEHEGQPYRVMRTYRTGLELEITCYREVNPDGGA